MKLCNDHGNIRSVIWNFLRSRCHLHTSGEVLSTDQAVATWETAPRSQEYFRVASFPRKLPSKPSRWEDWLAWWGSSLTCVYTNVPSGLGSRGRSWNIGDSTCTMKTLGCEKRPDSFISVQSAGERDTVPTHNCMPKVYECGSQKSPLKQQPHPIKLFRVLISESGFQFPLFRFVQGMFSGSGSKRERFPPSVQKLFLPELKQCYISKSDE